MTYQVSIEPSGELFKADPNQLSVENSSETEITFQNNTSVQVTVHFEDDGVMVNQEYTINPSGDATVNLDESAEPGDYQYSIHVGGEDLTDVTGGYPVITIILLNPPYVGHSPEGTWHPE